MSYDLYFTGKRVPQVEFEEYFSQRGHYELNEGQAWYSNEDTGVYFSFEYLEDEIEEDEIESFAQFNQNYFRPHYFALEAEPELAAFIEYFGCSVSDPQIDGIEEDTYSSEMFLRGWNNGNRAAYSIMLNSGKRPEEIYFRPTAELEAIWRWNYARKASGHAEGEDLFVPKIMFASLSGELKTYCVWPDAAQIPMPKTDLVLAIRRELAPKKIFRRKVDDFCFIEQAELEGLLPNFEPNSSMPTRKPHSEESMDSIRKFVRGRIPHQGGITGISLDNVLNSEYR